MAIKEKVVSNAIHGPQLGHEQRAYFVAKDIKEPLRLNLNICLCGDKCFKIINFAPHFLWPRPPVCLPLPHRSAHRMARKEATLVLWHLSGRTQTHINSCICLFYCKWSNKTIIVIKEYNFVLNASLKPTPFAVPLTELVVRQESGMTFHRTVYGSCWCIQHTSIFFSSLLPLLKVPFLILLITQF